MKRIFSLSAAALLVLAFASVANAQQRTFRAWSANCGKNACTASTRTPGGRVSLRFSRLNGADRAWNISFTGFQADMKPGSEIAVLVDNGPIRFFGSGSGYRTARGRVILKNVRQSSPLFSALLKGSRVALEFPHRDGFPIHLDFSLSGLSAALLWIDESQGRTTASHRQEAAQEPPQKASQEASQGSEPEQAAGAGNNQNAGGLPSLPNTPSEQGSTPGAPEAAQVKPTPTRVPAFIEKAHLADRECRDYKARHMLSSREIDRLDQNRILYVLPCYTGAYNVIYRIYVHDERYNNELKQQIFAGYSDEQGWYGRDTLINVSYNAGTKTLSAFEKGRGLGDCGSAPSFQWIKTGYWRLTEYRYWGPCDGSHTPEQWPVIFKHPKTKK